MVIFQHCAVVQLAESELYLEGDLDVLSYIGVRRAAILDLAPSHFLLMSRESA